MQVFGVSDFMDGGRDIAVVNYGTGNLFSIKSACESVGLRAHITTSKKQIMDADAVILPGVGAFGDAIKALRDLDLVAVLKESATSSKPFLGICLGMQMLLEESNEFGRHQGLSIVKGSVSVLQVCTDSTGRKVKVPHVGWTRIHKAKGGLAGDAWHDSFLEGLEDGEYMYFVHSFCVTPQDENLILSMSRYGEMEFCSSFQSNNIFGCQFHPERSGSQGLRIYKNLAMLLENEGKGVLNE